MFVCLELNNLRKFLTRETWRAFPPNRGNWLNIPFRLPGYSGNYDNIAGTILS